MDVVEDASELIQRLLAHAADLSHHPLLRLLVRHLLAGLADQSVSEVRGLLGDVVDEEVREREAERLQQIVDGPHGLATFGELPRSADLLFGSGDRVILFGGSHVDGDLLDGFIGFLLHLSFSFVLVC